MALSACASVRMAFMLFAEILALPVAKVIVVNSVVGRTSVTMPVVPTADGAGSAGIALRAPE